MSTPGRPQASARRGRSGGSAAPPSRWRISETSQFGHSQAWPQERQVRWVDQPRRLISRIALPPCARHLGERLAGPRMKRPRHAAAHVDDLHRRQPPSVHAARQLEPLELVPALGPRGRRPAEQHRAVLGGTPPRHLTGVVARIALLLVGGVVLLVDHDQAGIAYGGEDGRARSNADPGLARSAAAATRRSARRPASGNGAAQPSRRSAAGTDPSSAGSGRSRGRARSRPARGPAPPGPPRGTPRSSPSRSRRGAGRTARPRIRSLAEGTATTESESGAAGRR